MGNPYRDSPDECLLLPVFAGCSTRNLWQRSFAGASISTYWRHAMATARQLEQASILYEKDFLAWIDEQG